MTVREMVAERLKADGYDGLRDDWGECACKLEDLMPCGGDTVVPHEPPNCMPANAVDIERVRTQEDGEEAVV